MFWFLKYFWGVPTEILDGHYKTGPSADHFAKFHAGRPTRLGDLAREKKLKIWGKAQREFALRFESDRKEIRKKGKIYPASKSRGPNSNALAYAERALST